MTRSRKYLVALFSFFLAGSCLFSNGFANEGEIIADVVILGNRTVDDAVIMSKVKTRAGNKYAQLDINEDLKRLYALGYFTNISVDVSPIANGLKVAFIVKEKPFLKDILLEGNKVFKNDKILNAMESKVNRVLDESKVKADIEVVRNLYQGKGYYSADIAYKITTDEKSGRAILAIRIEEGQKLHIKEVQLVGVKAFKERKVRGVMKTKNRWLLRPGFLKEEELRNDLDRVRALYVSKGYIDAKVAEGERIYNADKSELTIPILIEEGGQYTVTGLTLEGNQVFPSGDMQSHLKVVPGTLFIPELFRKDVQALEDYYLEKGYIDSKVRADTNIEYGAGKMSITYTIQEGEVSYVEKIDIQGNIVTQDRVIRRELAITPGSKFDGVRIRRSQERLQNLGYFKTVDVDYKPTDKSDRKDLVLTVDEKKTGELSFGAGFSSIDNLIGFAEITQSNFDWKNWPTFVGAGQKLRLRVEAGPRRQDFLVSYTEPWFLNRRLSVGFDGFANSSQFLSDRFDEDRIGFNLRAGRPITAFTRADFVYTLEKIDLDVDDGASSLLKEEAGERVVSKVGVRLDRDTRDNFVFPTRGQRALLNGEVAGLGGDTDFTKADLKVAQYFPVPLFDGHVFKLVGETGLVGEFGDSTRVPIFDRFFLGGPNNLRGFRFRKAGPKDDTGEPIGGDFKISGTAEYTFPVLEFLHGAFFFDAGNVYRDLSDVDTNINSDVGVGVRLRLPIGPVQLDYGFPVTTDNETDKGNGQFQFNLGTTF